ncbi:hypothetical protein BO82DRAFT_184573 [Aspergillus uvarum CBS 121591]|uniref:Uncharacterized protein n=1 Tax=Aspergillus uvarum CBS 121591 TaxID=1448315 RepID=A0A319D2Y2_9EURO|nr:hypothetical protein BO82DRAFT_184573 [Aspergillus uvarum CBS 121591]PYH85433.1 hypothetical protein BO82DRAFT_184573 [Aspergillus uvarum CBS 121591]
MQPLTVLNQMLWERVDPTARDFLWSGTLCPPAISRVDITLFFLSAYLLSFIGAMPQSLFWLGLAGANFGRIRGRRLEDWLAETADEDLLVHGSVYTSTIATWDFPDKIVT